MAGLNIGHHPFAQDDYKNLNSPLLDTSPTISSETKDLPQNEMAVLSSECEEDSDCTHEATCVNRGAMIGKHCFCFETGEICSARPKPQNPPPINVPDTPIWPGTGSSECKADSDCVSDAKCEDIAGAKHCFCLETGRICNARPKPQDDIADTVVPSTTPSNSMHHGVIHKEQLQRILNSTSTNQTTTVVRSQLGAESAMLQIVLPLGVLLFLGVVIIIICLRRQRQHRLGPQRSSETVVKSGDAVMLLDRMNNINKNPTYFVSPGDDPTQRKFLVREICMDHIVLVDVVGEGAFGQVYRGELHCPETNSQQLVAVKVLKENVSNEIREDFEREVEIMSAFDHDNILKLVGVVTQNAGQSPYMIFEYMVHGDLAELLRKNDPVLLKKDSDVIRLQKPDLVDTATQIANGMRYLTSQHFVHRDLATRNCLVGEGLVVKISDFGMSRDIYTCDYYKIGGSRMLPVRWMSPESVKYGRFTSESDAWAYGVVLWEIFSCGRQPYYGHSNEEVVRFLDAGILLQRPEDCPSTIYHIMLGCWKADPKERLSFDKIHKHLQDYHQRLVKMAASQSQPSTPASEGEVQVKMPEMPESSSPELPPMPESALLQGPRPKPLLKATQSDPQAGSGKVASPSLVEASRTSSQTLTQHRVQPKPELQPKPQEMMAESPDVVYQVKLPPLQPAAQTSAATPRPCPQPQLDVQVAVVKSDSPPITAKAVDGHSSSLEKLHGTDSGFSSGEQQWDDLVDESTAAATPLIHTPPSGDIILEPLTSIVCTNPTEVV